MDPPTTAEDLFDSPDRRAEAANRRTDDSQKANEHVQAQASASKKEAEEYKRKLEDMERKFKYHSKKGNSTQSSKKRKLPVMIAIPKRYVQY